MLVQVGFLKKPGPVPGSDRIGQVAFVDPGPFYGIVFSLEQLLRLHVLDNVGPADLVTVLAGRLALAPDEPHLVDDEVPPALPVVLDVAAGQPPELSLVRVRAGSGGVPGPGKQSRQTKVYVSRPRKGPRDG